MAIAQGKSVSRIRRDRLTRVFVGTHSIRKVGQEMWRELGHFLKGVEGKAAGPRERNGHGGEFSAGGFIVNWTGELVQTTVGDLDLYAVLQATQQGRVNVALLTGNRLRLYRLVKVAGVWADNRVQLAIDDVYSGLDKAAMTLSGYVDGYEEAFLKSDSTGVAIALNSTNLFSNLDFTMVGKMNYRGLWDLRGASLPTPNNNGTA